MENSEINRKKENFEINMTSKKNEKENSPKMTRVAYTLSNLSSKTLFFFSFVSSGFLSYKYLKNKEVYTEFNGHFNSPRNLLNQRMKYFHLQEALARFGLGAIFISGVTFFVCKKVLKD